MKPDSVKAGYTFTDPNMIGEVDEYFYHGDHISSVVLVTDKKAKVVQQFAYMPFGELLVDNSTVDLDYRFSAKENDRESGLGYFGARYYDNTSAMWLGVDPLWEKYAGMNPYNYCAGNPVMLVDEKGMYPTTKEAAEIAAHVYGDTDDQILSGGWSLVGDIQYHENGFQYGVYSRQSKNGEMDYVLAFAGTNDGIDLKVDVFQALGLPVADQYGNAVDVAKKFDYYYGDGQRTIVGHSLGGGLAAVGSIATGIDAVTFNPAAVHDNTLWWLGLDWNSTDQIQNYIVCGEFVNSLQYNLGVYPPGNTTYLKSNTEGFLSSLKNHTMNKVIESLNK